MLQIKQNWTKGIRMFAALQRSHTLFCANYSWNFYWIIIENKYKSIEEN